ncbi:MAG: hypothetical protein AB7V42_05955 [Thermoleophilia bacterium]
MSARARLAAAAVAAALAAAGTAQASPGALDALATRDAYVAPRVLGEASAAGEATLVHAATRLARERRPVKLAIVLGPAGAPSMSVYARRLSLALRARTSFEGTLVVTAPGRAVVAVGPIPPAEVTRRLRAARVSREPNLVDRVLLAASLTAPPPPDDSGAARRHLLLLLGLAALGGAWAVAWGQHRTERRKRDRTVQARAAMLVCVQGIAARARALAARRDLPDERRAALARAIDDCVAAEVTLGGARTVDAVGAVRAVAHAGLDAVAAAERSLGEPGNPDDPFAGLCVTDPAHGPPQGHAGLCARCADTASRGPAPARRRIPAGRDGADYTYALRWLHADGEVREGHT